MLLSLVVVPLVSLVTKPVPFEVNPPTLQGAIDREFQHELDVEATVEKPFEKAYRQAREDG